jgi:uncharacterized cupredoxin-like copper-binding protein
MKLNSFRILVLAAPIILSLAACAVPPPVAPKPAGPTVVHVKVSEWKVEVDRSSVPTGAVKFMIDNVGQKQHELVLEEAGAVDKALEANGKTAEASDIDPGKSAVLEWTIDKPGKYQVACHKNVDGTDHFKAGMTIPLTVTGQ